MQYYVAGRSATFAGSFPVAGNLFHHAVEMFLKSFLLDNHSALLLKRNFNHNLKMLWREFKRIANEPALTKFDSLVSSLNKVEELRYPSKGYMFSLAVGKGPPAPASGPATKGLKEYNLNLEEIDEFVVTLLTGRVTPEWIRSLLFEDARAQYKRENLHPFFPDT